MEIAKETLWPLKRYMGLNNMDRLGDNYHVQMKSAEEIKEIFPKGKAEHKAIIHDDEPCTMSKEAWDVVGNMEPRPEVTYVGVDFAKESHEQTVVFYRDDEGVVREVPQEKDLSERVTEGFKKLEAKYGICDPLGRSRMKEVNPLTAIDKEILAKVVAMAPEQPAAKTPAQQFHNLKIMMVFGNMQAIKQYQASAFGNTVPVHIMNDQNGNQLMFMDATASHKNFIGKRPDKIIVFTKAIPRSIKDELLIMRSKGSDLLEAPHEI